MKCLSQKFLWFYILYVVSSLLIVSATGHTDHDADFEEISTSVPQGVTKVHLPPKCTGGTTKHPKTMFTFVPSSTTKVRITTFPADLVTAEARSGGEELRLEWNSNVAGTANEGGVQIFIPAHQLEELSVAADAQAQVLNGFTNVHHLQVSSDAKLYASLQSLGDGDNNNKKLSVSISSDATSKIISGAPISDAKVSSDGKLSLEAPGVERISVSSDGEAEIYISSSNITTTTAGYADVSSDGKLTIDGDLSNGADVSSDGKLTVYGTVNGRVRLSSDAKLYVGDDLLGNVEASSDAKVHAPNCNTVTTRSDAKCYIDTGISGDVRVEIETLPFTRTGTRRCGWGGLNSATGWTVAAVSLAVIFGIGYFLWSACCRHKNCRDKKQQASPPPPTAYGGGGEPEVEFLPEAYAEVEPNGGMSASKKEQTPPTPVHAEAIVLDSKDDIRSAADNKV